MSAGGLLGVLERGAPLLYGPGSPNTQAPDTQEGQGEQSETQGSSLLPTPSPQTTSFLTTPEASGPPPPHSSPRPHTATDTMHSAHA